MQWKRFLPSITAFPASQKTHADIPGIFSKYTAHSHLKYFSNDVLNLHSLVGGVALIYQTDRDWCMITDSDGADFGFWNITHQTVAN